MKKQSHFPFIILVTAVAIACFAIAGLVHSDEPYYQSGIQLNHILASFNF